jgi:hypothetical protein
MSDGSAKISALQKHLSIQFKSIRDLLGLLNGYLSRYKEPEYAEYIEFVSRNMVLIDDINEAYDLGSIDLLNEEKLNIDEILQFLNQENIISKLNQCFASVSNFIDNTLIKLLKIPVDKSRIAELSALFKNNMTENSIKRDSFNICNSCHTKMLKKGDSTLICVACGFTKNLEGTEIEEAIQDIQDTHRQKYINTIVKKGQMCLDLIQAKVAVNIPEDIYETIKRLAHADGVKNLFNLSCESIRSYLKTARIDGYNDYVPLIHIKLCGTTPVLLTNEEEQTCLSYFKHIVIFFDKTKENKSNRPYNYYFIYKILEIITDGSLEVESGKKKWKIVSTARKTRILERIHLQAKNTLKNNDLIWKGLCVLVPEFTYRPTSRIR